MASQLYGPNGFLSIHTLGWASSFTRSAWIFFIVPGREWRVFFSRPGREWRLRRLPHLWSDAESNHPPTRPEPDKVKNEAG
jgi:hypothetical protein